MFLFRICGGDGSHQGGRPSPVLNLESWVEAFSNFLLWLHRQLAPPVSSGFRTTVITKPTPPLSVHAQWNQVLCHFPISWGCVSGEMKSFGLGVGGYDHPHGYAILLAGPNISHAYADEFLPCFMTPSTLCQRSTLIWGCWVTYFFHVEHIHSVRLECAKDCKENGDGNFIHSDLLFCSIFWGASRRVGNYPLLWGWVLGSWNRQGAEVASNACGVLL